MNPETVLLYTIGAAVLIISPGPDFIYVTTRGIAQGKKAGLLSAMGISMGLLIHTLLAALGLSALVKASETIFEIIKYIGAGYLLYLGIKALLSKRELVQNQKARVQNGGRIFQQGILTNVFNPKAIITFFAFIPQFITAGDKTAPLQIALLGAIIAVQAIIWFGIVGYFAGTLGSWLAEKSSVQKAIKYVTGSILIALGLRLALSRNR